MEKRAVYDGMSRLYMSFMLPSRGSMYCWRYSLSRGITCFCRGRAMAWEDFRRGFFPYT